MQWHSAITTTSIVPNPGRLTSEPPQAQRRRREGPRARLPRVLGRSWRVTLAAFRLSHQRVGLPELRSLVLVGAKRREPAGLEREAVLVDDGSLAVRTRERHPLFRGAGAVKLDKEARAAVHGPLDLDVRLAKLRRQAILVANVCLWCEHYPPPDSSSEGMD